MSSPDSEEQQLQALLAQAGRREQPPLDKQQQFEAVFRRELQPVITAKRQRRRSFYAATAAVTVLAAGVALLLSPPVQPPIVVAEVVSAVDGNQTFSNGGKNEPLTDGSSVHVGQTVRTSRQGMLALAYRDADVRLNRDTTVRFHAARIELIDGTIYIDTGNDRQHGAPPVVITTRLGSFSHVGTQFMVDVDNNREVTAAVREGTIRLRTDNVQKNIAATADEAKTVTLSRSGDLDTRPAPRSGELWSWVVGSSPGKVVSGLTGDEILAWIARETGQRVRYADAQSRATAMNEKMIGRGDQPISPGQALAQLRATFVSIEVDDSHGEVLLVSTRD